MSARDPRTAFLADAAILASLRRSIAARVPAQEVDDLAQATLLEAWRAADYPVERNAFDRWLSLKGRSNAIDFLRKSGRRRQWHGKDDGEVDDLPGARPEPVHDARDALRFTQAKLDARAAKGASVRWLLASVRGETFASIAEAEGTSEDAVTKSVQRLRSQLRGAWLAVAALAIFWIARGLFEDQPEVGQGHPEPAPSEAPTPAPDAGALRERALGECDAKQWKACLDDLESASAADPAGDADPAVQRAKQEALRYLPPKP